jgi:hypothetical protein
MEAKVVAKLHEERAAELNSRQKTLQYLKPAGAPILALPGPPPDDGKGKLW